MSKADIDDTIRQFHKLSVESHSGRKKRIGYGRFREICKGPSYPDRLPPFFDSSKEVALYSEGELYIGDKRQAECHVPVLNEDISQLSLPGSEKKSLLSPYKSYDLFEPFNGVIPLMSDDELNNVMPCFDYISDWKSHQATKGKEYGDDYKYVIISARHHIKDIAMTLFEVNRGTHYNVICIVLKGKYLVLSLDKVYSKPAMNVSKMSLTSQKLCNSGFVFENLLTGSKPNDKCIPIYSISEHVHNKDVLLLLRSEIDAYNDKTKSYSELKCFGRLSMGNIYHRHKLLKTWVQTQFLPDCDIIIGTRDNHSGLLLDIDHYSREEFYEKLNNRDSVLTRNFNLKEATEWTKYCIDSMIELVNANIDRTDKKKLLSPRAFRINIDPRKNMSIKQLEGIPTNIEIPEEYL